MAKPTAKINLSKAFKAGTLPPASFGDYFEEYVQYRGFYLNKKGRRNWSGPWRNDENAAKMDNWPFAKDGFSTGIMEKH